MADFPPEVDPGTSRRLDLRSSVEKAGDRIAQDEVAFSRSREPGSCSKEYI
jgi:hypothetical protein